MEIGDRLHDRYRIKSLLGKGAFAQTWLAVDDTTGTFVAIKELRLSQAQEWKTVELFEREAKVLANLRHPQIPQLLDSFFVDTEHDRHFYLVQTFIPGTNLAELVRQGRHFSVVDTIEIGMAVCRILTYLHTLSPPVIHRDLKPSNLIMGDDGTIYLIDFGSVRDSLKQDHLSGGGGSTVVGTYGYMPFEQFSGRAVPASDLYALGATLLFLLSHKYPSDMEIENMRVDYRPHVQVNSTFAAVLDQLLAPNWRERYASADVARKALDGVVPKQHPEPESPHAPSDLEVRQTKLDDVWAGMMANLEDPNRWDRLSRTGPQTAPSGGTTSGERRITKVDIAYKIAWYDQNDPNVEAQNRWRRKIGYAFGLIVLAYWFLVLH